VVILERERDRERETERETERERQRERQRERRERDRERHRDRQREVIYNKAQSAHNDTKQTHSHSQNIAYFDEPAEKSVPGYSDIIAVPMDLGTIQNRVGRTIQNRVDETIQNNLGGTVQNRVGRIERFLAVNFVNWARWEIR
jgi:hypothetical protein